MELPDLNALTLVQAAVVLTIVTLLDVAAAYVLAITHGNFSLAVVALWIQSHTLKRVFPIFALAVIGHGIPQLGIEPIGPFWLMGLAGLAAYALETIKSIMVSFSDTTPPQDTEPSSPPPPGG